MDSSASVFRMSMSRVPWTRSLGLSAICAFLLRVKRKDTPLLPIVKRRGKRGPALAYTTYVCNDKNTTFVGHQGIAKGCAWKNYEVPIRAIICRSFLRENE